jgi:hypothetical protein
VCFLKKKHGCSYQIHRGEQDFARVEPICPALQRLYSLSPSKGVFIRPKPQQIRTDLRTSCSPSDRLLSK